MPECEISISLTKQIKQTKESSPCLLEINSTFAEGNSFGVASIILYSAVGRSYFS